MISHILPTKYFPLGKNQAVHYLDIKKWYKNEGEYYQPFREIETQIFISSFYEDIDNTIKIINELEGKNIIVSIPSFESRERDLHNIRKLKNKEISKIVKFIEGKDISFLRRDFEDIQEDPNIWGIGIRNDIPCPREALLKQLNALLHQKRQNDPTFRYKPIFLIGLESPYIDQVLQMGFYRNYWDITLFSDCAWNLSACGVCLHPEKGAMAKPISQYKRDYLWNPMAWAWNTFCMAQWEEGRKPNFGSWSRKEEKE